jgi:hypothetical protein
MRQTAKQPASAMRVGVDHQARADRHVGPVGDRLGQGLFFVDGRGAVGVREEHQFALGRQHAGAHRRSFALIDRMLDPTKLRPIGGMRLEQVDQAVVAAVVDHDHLVPRTVPPRQVRTDRRQKRRQAVRLVVGRQDDGQADRVGHGNSGWWAVRSSPS